jgi:transcriptional regulator with XRE-family HTH domain/tetratricopeptide (TPR) repeat protein
VQNGVTGSGQARSDPPAPAAVFGELLRTHRARLGLTQADVADAAGTSVRTMTGLETGRVRPRPGTARLLADALSLVGAERARFLDATGREPPAGEPGPTFSGPTPAQLPAALVDFTGRGQETAELDGLIGSGVRIVVLTGTGGVGKTALTVRWAREAAGRFPDGQLYVDLRGFAAGPPVQPIEALAGFLDALGVPADRVPPQETAAATLFRSLLADRRMLIVLDNAAEADVVRPLLPGGGNSVVVVTSRRLLTGLAVSHSVRRLTLGALDRADAVNLVSGIVGPDRAPAEPAAMDALIEACAGLPLALRIAAANIRADPHLDVADYVAELQHGNRLERLTVEGDPSSSVRATFDRSYARLPTHVQRLFRFLGLVPGATLTAGAAAALVACGAAEARRSLRGLADAHLVESRAQRQYALHDLLRDYAIERGRAEDLEAERHAATRRLLDWYLHSTAAATEIVSPGLLRLPHPPSPDGVEPVRHRDRAAALGWLEAERRNLVAAVVHAADAGLHRPAYLLADALRGYFDTTGPMVEWMTVAHVAVAAADADGDLTARSAAAANLAHAHAHSYLGQYDTAIELGTLALSLARRAGWTAGEARSLNHLGVMHAECGRLNESIVHFTDALALSRQTGNRKDEVTCLLNLGVVAELAGRLNDALEYGRLIDTDAAPAHPTAMANLAYVQMLVGDFAAAAGSLAAAHAAVAAGSTRQAHVLAVESSLYLNLGRLAEARERADLSEAIANRNSDRYQGIKTASSRAAVDLHTGFTKAALVGYRSVLHETGDVGFGAARATAMIGLADAQRRLGRLDEAAASAGQALALAESSGYRVFEGEAHALLAEISLDRADHAALATARQHGEHALALQRATGHRLGEAGTLLLLGRIADAAGHSDAASHREAAQTLCAQIGLPGDGVGRAG